MGRFGGRLGVIVGNVVLENVLFREKRGFRKNKVSRGDFGRSWVDLGAQEAPKWVPRRVQRGVELSWVGWC